MLMGPSCHFGTLETWTWYSIIIVSQKFLSAPLSHYDVILGEPWLRDNKIIMDYAHKYSGSGIKGRCYQ